MTEEMVDVVDGENRVVGSVTRSRMRAERLPHRSTAILVEDSHGRILVHKRVAHKDINPSHWDLFVGGVVATGEDYDETARRETTEEAGIENPRLEPLFIFHYTGAESPCFVGVYRTIHDGPVRLQAEEIEEGRFVEVEELEEMMRREPFCPDSVMVWWRIARERRIAPDGRKT